MRYKTSFMENILKSAVAQDIVDYVSPIYGESYTGLWMFEIIGLEMDEVKGFVEDLYNQIFIKSATWAIPYWEKAYGITSNPNMSTEQRREQIILWKTKRSMNPKKMEGLLEAISGVRTEVIENTGQNTFHIRFYGTVENIDEVMKKISSIKPAHLIYTMSMAEEPGTSSLSEVAVYYKLFSIEQETANAVIKEV